MRGSGQFYELYAQRFTDSVNALISRTKNQKLSDHITEKARAGGDYVEDGHWSYDLEENDVTFHEYANPSLLSRRKKPSHNRKWHPDLRPSVSAALKRKGNIRI